MYEIKQNLTVHFFTNWQLFRVTWKFVTALSQYIIYAFVRWKNYYTRMVRSALLGAKRLSRFKPQKGINLFKHGFHDTPATGELIPYSGFLVWRQSSCEFSSLIHKLLIVPRVEDIRCKSDIFTNIFGESGYNFLNVIFLNFS